MAERKVDPGFIPLDKSRTIRAGALDLLNGQSTTIMLLRSQSNLSGDLKSLLRASEEWIAGCKEIHVGEAGTLYRFLRFASWKYGIDKNFVLEGTLKNREICSNPTIVNMPLAVLLTLDNHTSQWASAAVLMGNKEVVPNQPFKLAVTRDVLGQWEEHRKRGEPLPAQYDETIRFQANAFANRADGKVIFTPRQSEDYCFARAFGLMNREEGAARWPSLAGHESNRLIGMDENLGKLENGMIVDSQDHRVVQAVAMRARAIGKAAQFSYPESVNKSWPQFWDFLYAVSRPTS